jgi:CRISPR-associated protein Csd1
MLLQRLREYNQRFEAAPSMYVSTPIRWLIDLNRQGHLQGFVPLQGEGKRGKRGKEFLAPHVGRSSEVSAKLLADRADYALGFAGSDATTKKQTRTKEIHQAFVGLVRECSTATGEPAVEAVLKFLERLELSTSEVPADLAPGDVVTFRVEEVLPIDLESVQSFWANRQQQAATRTSKGAACLACGQIRPVAARHRIKIKGIPEGQSSGMALVSANMPAFESYGLQASQTAPICIQCTEDYANGANRLIRDERTRWAIGSLLYLFWTKDASVPAFASLLRDPQPEDVKELLQAVRTGRAGSAKIDETPFYATALSAAGGRVAVREWLETTVGAAKSHVASYFGRQRIVDQNGSEGKPIGLFSLTASLVRDPGDLAPQVPKAFIRSALTGAPLPFSLLVQAVERIRAEPTKQAKRAKRPQQRVTRPRAAVIKMVLSSLHPEEAHDMEQLRLLAILCG